MFFWNREIISVVLLVAFSNHFNVQRCESMQFYVNEKSSHNGEAELHGFAELCTHLSSDGLEQSFIETLSPVKTQLTVLIIISLFLNFVD